MSYRVVKYFEDLQDNSHAYYVGDVFPRVGMAVSEERLEELMSTDNKQHAQLIQYEEDEPMENGEPESKTYTEEELSEMTSKEIKSLAAELGYEIARGSKSDIIEQFLEAQKKR